MKYLQDVLIVCIVTTGLSMIWGCAILGSEANRSITGFAYPQVPNDYPYNVPWHRSEAERARIPQDELEEQELLSMVMVKLWSEGDRDFTGGVITNGTFYPLYPDVAYVEWEQHQEPDGTIHRYASNVLTTAGNDSSAIMDQLNNGETPPGIGIVDYQSAGIDPYQFLSKE
jgi:hypothetical protein